MVTQTSATLTGTPGGIKIALLNQSAKVSDAEVKEVLHALQVQITRDFYPVWGINAELSFVPTGSAAPADAWQLVFLDNSDQADALGYHDVTAAGLPLGKVFCVSTVQDGGKWSVTASHELMEMLVDPYCELTAFNQATATTGTLIAYEVCDPVEADDSGYNIGGVRVSNFVFPTWFEGGVVGKVDFLGELASALSMGPEGYVSSFSIPATKGWVQQQAPSRLASKKLLSAERLALRATPKSLRVPSAS